MRKAAPFVPPRWETHDPGQKAKGSYGPAVEKWAKRYLGLSLDAWQSYALTNALRHDAKGDLLYRTVLIGTGRQNGKSVLVRLFYGWLLTEGRILEPFSTWSLILNAAHDAHQARIIYRAVHADLINTPDLKAKLSKITEYRGIQGGNIFLTTVTGQPGSARGLSAGCIAFDELQEQKSFDLIQALRPTQSAQRSPLLFYTATAGHVDSLVLRETYDRLRRQVKGEDDRFYGAWWESRNPEAGLDWDAVQEANPSLGYRISRAEVEDEFKSQPLSSFRQERLNHFALTKANTAFNEVAWNANRVPNALEGITPLALGVDVHPGWQRATISVAGIRPDGKVGIEIYRDFRATEQNPVTAKRITDAIERFPDPIIIAFDNMCAAAPALMRHGQTTGLPYDALAPAAIMSACMDVSEMVLSHRLAVDDPLLDYQVNLTAKRMIGQEGGFRFSRAASLGPIDAVMAMTFAAHAISRQPAAPMIYIPH